MAQQLNLNLTSIHKAGDKEFPADWPAGLTLPGNCYIDTDGVVVFNPMTGSWQGCVLLNLPHAAVLDFLRNQFSQFGAVEVDPGPKSDRSWNIVVRPSSGEFGALSAILAKSNFDDQWSLIYFEFVGTPVTSPPASGAPAAAGTTSNGS